MVALVSVETVLLVVLVVLVAGLLRSHAELLRRVGPPSDDAPAPPRAAPGDEFHPGLPPLPAEARSGGPSAIAGVTLSGDAVKLDFDGPGTAPTLLAFLSSGCATCAGFWEALGTELLPAGLRAVIVTRGGERERPARLRSLAPAEIPVLMSSAAWEDYAVPGSPYFILVDGTIRGEGVATKWEGLSSLVADAIAEQELLRERVPAGTRRARAVDTTLAAHGIGPGHPSLYPSRSES
jgi:hypothetical protein